MSKGTELINDILESATKEEKVFRLTVELHDTKQLKKDSNKAYNEEIKRIQAEIDALLEDDTETEKTND